MTNTKADLEDVAKSPCPTCLTRGRTMLPLRDAAGMYAMLLATMIKDVELSNMLYSDMKVCWECHTFLYRILRFQAQVNQACTLLQGVYQNADDSQCTINSLSRLSNVSKSGFDYVLDHDDEDFFGAEWDLPVSKVQIKLEEDPIKEGNHIENVLLLSNRRSARKRARKEHSGKRPKKKVKRVVENSKAKRDVVTWPGRKILLKGGNKNVKIVSITMSEEEMLKYREEDLDSKQFVEAPFKCTECVRGFSQEIVFLRHNSTHHKEEIGPHVCPICKSHYAEVNMMRRHVRAHYSMYTCSECGFTHRFLREVIRHYNAAHEPGKTYPCAQCDKVFPTGRKMRYHRDAVHKDVHQCEHCDKILSNAASLKCHRQIHAGMATIECSVCRKPCRGESGLYGHMRTVHKQDTGEDTYCPDCNVQFKTRYNYKAHLRTSKKHITPAQLKLQCKKCNTRCKNETALRMHDRNFHEEYICHICNKQYNSMYSLRGHIDVKHKGRLLKGSHVCESCGKSFATKQRLERHLLTHTGERPHECDVCGSKFSQKSTMKTHQKLVHFKS